MQSQYWCITINAEAGSDLLTKTYWEQWLAENVRVVGFRAQLEAVARQHVQMFLIFDSRVRFGQVKQWLPREAHIERMRGTPSTAWEYCSKEDTRVPAEQGGWQLEKGQKPISAAGKRTDVEIIRDLVQEGKDYLTIVDTVPSALRMRNFIEEYRRLLEDSKQRQIPEEVKLRPWQEEFHAKLDGPIKSRRIWWLWSPHSAVGKTTTMHAYAASRPGQMLVGDKNMNNLLCAYNKHRVIWFDFSRSDPLDATATTVLEQLSNGGPLFAGKYQSCQKWVSAHVVVTCNREPPTDRLPERIDEWYIDSTGYRSIPPAPERVE